VVAFEASGRPDFGLLQHRMHVRHPSPALLSEVPAVLVVFDVLWLEGEVLVPRSQTERRSQLEALALGGPSWQTTPVLDGDPQDLLAGARTLGLEGLVAKQRDAPYRPGQRSDAWIKVKWRCEREFVVGGWSEGEGNRRGSIGSLAIGYVDPSCSGADLLERPVLRYVGQVGSGLSSALAAELAAAFERYATPTGPFIDPPSLPRLHWVAPLLVVQVAYAEVTAAGTLRHPTLLGLRDDVDPQDVGWDEELARPGERAPGR
jgi:bifunctional non-homologous end joining protein LigD